MTTMIPERTIVEKPVEVQILERAAELLEEFGWCQCALATFTDGTVPDELENIHDSRIGSFCAMGAIWRATADLGYMSPKWKDLVTEVKRRGLGANEIFNVLAHKAGVDNWAPLVTKNDIESTEASQMTAHFRSLAKERMPA